MIFIKCSRWADFTSNARGAKFAVYEYKIELFRVYAVFDEHTLVYEEPIQIVKTSQNGVVNTVVTMAAENYTIAAKPIEKRLGCGLSYLIIPKLSKSKGGWISIYEIGPEHEKVRSFLAQELNLPESKIIQGSLSQF